MFCANDFSMACFKNGGATWGAVSPWWQYEVHQCGSMTQGLRRQFPNDNINGWTRHVEVVVGSVVVHSRIGSFCPQPKLTHALWSVV